MSLMEKIFGAKQPPASMPNQPAPAQPNPTNNPNLNAPPAQQAATAGTDANGTLPPGAAKAPDDKYATLWQPATTEEQNAAGATQQQAPVDSQKLMEAAAKVDFSKIVTNDMLAKISGGGEDAAQAFVQAMNLTAQTVYGQSMVVTSKIVEQAVSQAEQRFQDRIPSILRNQGAKQRVFEENPAFSNPAYAPLIEAQVQQLASKYPKATQAELNGMAKEYLQGFATAVSPPKADASADKGKTGDAGEDWDSYVS